MVETGVAVWPDRHVPIAAIVEQCRALGGSGAVDGILIPDQLANFIPRQLWTAENTPLAAFMPDPDSLCDAFMVGPYIASAVPELRLHLTTDSVRRSPAELIQSMLTLAYLTDGKATFEIGGGELKQSKPFGHPTNQGMSRMKDLFAIFRIALENGGPFDYEGRRWTFERASLGAGIPHTPQIWGLGGGPQLLDHVTSYADGLAIAVPNAWPTADAAREQIAAIRTQLEQKGRDPEAFKIGIWACALMHDDPRVLDAALENPILRFVAGALGRTEPAAWAQAGLSSPVPDGWTYYKDLLPSGLDDQFVEDVVGAVTREHVTNGFLTGTPADVAARVEPFLELGIDYVCAFDYLPIVNNPADAPAGLGRVIDLCAQIKQHQPAHAA